MKRPIFIVLIILAASTLGQYYFGKNKIQYRDYDWQRLRTEHFDIYFFGAEEELARITAYDVEEFWEDHVGNFRFVPRSRVPVIIYPTPNLFQETNTISWILPEGVGGFTEYYKGRVVLPFNGDYNDFRHTLKHELVHAFILHKNTFVHDAHELFFLNFLPLWFEEGLAEFLSEGTSPEMDMVIRSGALEESLVSLENIYSISGSFLMYKEAQSFLNWLGKEYGSARIPLVIDDIHDFKYFDELFEAHFGISLEKAGQQWMDAIHDKYWPMTIEGDLPHRIGKPITRKHEGINLSPLAVQSLEDSIPCILMQSTRMNYPAIYCKRGEKSELVIRGGFNEKIEDMHLFDNSFSVSQNGVLAMSAKAQGGDVLTFIELKNSEILFRKKFDSIPGINSPQLDSSAHRVTFSGTNMKGFTDIYLFFVEEDSLIRLTEDIYGDFNPVFWNEYIIFDSDRNTIGEKSICKIPSCGGKIEFLSGLGGNNYQPSPMSDGSILMSSSHNKGIQNIWHFVPDSLTVSRRTNILTGFFEPTEYHKDSILTTVYSKNTYQIMAIPFDSIFETIEVEWKPWTKQWKPRQLAKTTARDKIGYDTKFSFDIAQGTISTSTSMESGGGIEGMFSDMLGDKQLYFMVYDQGHSLKDLLENLNIVTIFYDESDRPILGFGAYHYYNEGFNIYDWSFSEENTGILGSISYPFNRFMRADATAYLEYSKKTHFFEVEPDREGAYSTLNLSLIRDNAHWGITGPLEGFRGNTTVGATLRLNNGEISSHLASADLRYYLRLTKRSALATRLVGRTSGGPEPQRFWMGGTWDFRGYPFYSFYGRNLVFASTELRFPLIEQFRMRFPFLDINLRGINGAIFLDLGQTWENEWLEPLGSTGIGLKMNLGNITCLRFDVAWRTDFHEGLEKPYYDIFFGWDF
ncbi:hypothetical protein KAH81_01085 [bacterium]|nr:hypothetical protein [bacterium]